MSEARRRQVLWVIFWIGTVLIAIVAQATTLVRLPFPELVQFSDAIVRARCVDSGAVLENGEIWTDTQFLVLTAEKGAIGGQIVVRQPGGTYQHLQSHVEGTPKFQKGEELYLFLDRAKAEHYALTGWSQGTFRIRKDLRTGMEKVTQDSAELPVFDPQSHQFQKSGVREMQLALFVEQLRRTIHGEAAP